MAATKKLPNPPRYGGANGVQKLPPLLDCRPFKGPKLTEEGRPFEPKYGEPGSYVSWGAGAGVVWSQGQTPRSSWVHLEGAPSTLVLVRLDGEGSGLEMERRDYSRP